MESFLFCRSGNHSRVGISDYILFLHDDHTFYKTRKLFFMKQSGTNLNYELYNREGLTALIELLHKSNVKLRKLIKSILATYIVTVVVLCVIFAFCLFIAEAKAEPVKIHLVHVQGQDSATKSEMIQVFRKVKREYKDRTGIVLKRASISTISNPYPTINTLDGRFDQFYAMDSEVRKFAKKKGELVYFFMPPLQDGVGGTYKAGKAILRCGPDFWYTYTVGWHKKNDIERSIGLMMHELGHSLNAVHVDNDSLMSSYLPAGTNRCFDSFSLKQVRGCVK